MATAATLIVCPFATVTGVVRICPVLRSARDANLMASCLLTEQQQPSLNTKLVGDVC
jgi:hypothetical protein